MSVIKVDQIQGSTGTTVTIPSGTTIVNSGTATNFGISDTNANVSSLVKQWGNLNGSSFGLRDSMNTSSATDQGTGDHTFTLTNNMDNDDYSAQATHNSVTNGDKNSCMLKRGADPTTSAYRVETCAQNGTAADCTHVMGMIAGDLA